EIKKHAENIGQVLAGYDMQDKEAPAEISKLHGQLLALQCRHALNMVTKELGKDEPDRMQMQKEVQLASNIAKVLAIGYGKDDTLLKEVQELEKKMHEGV